MLGRVLLDEFQKQLKKIRENLSLEATAAYESIKSISVAADKLNNYLKEFEPFKELFSPEYLQTLQNEIDEMNLKVKDIIVLTYNNELIKLLEEVNTLTIEITHQADLLDELKTIIVQTIKDTLNSLYAKLREEHDKEISSRLLKGNLDFKEAGQLELAPLQKIIALLDYYKISPILSNPPRVILEKNELCFSDRLDEMPLTEVDLIKCANQVIWATNNPSLFVALKEKKVGFQKSFHDYLRCESWLTYGGNYYLSIEPSARTLIDAKPSSLQMVERLEVSASQKSVAAEKQLQDVIMPVINACQKELQLLTVKLTQQCTITAAQLEKLDEDLNTALLKIKALTTENNNLNLLLAEQENLLAIAAKIPTHDFKKHKEHGRLIYEKINLVKAQRKTVEEAKQAANESLKFAVIFANEKEEEIYRGIRYANIKSRYTKEIYPLYNDALKTAKQCLEKADDEKNMELRKFSFQLQKLQVELKERKRELAESPPLQNVLSKLEEKFNQAEVACQQLETCITSSKTIQEKIDRLCQDVPEDVWLENLEHRMAEITELKNQLIEIKTKNQFEEKRVEAANLLQNLYQDDLPDFIKSTRNYKEFANKLDRLRAEFLENANHTFELSKNVAELQQRIEHKRSNLIDQLFLILQTVLSDENIKNFWYPQVAGKKSSFVDESKIKIGNIYFAVPRGICNARQDLDKLTNDPALTKCEVVRQACLSMRKRLTPEEIKESDNENEKKKTTTEFYRAVSDCLVGNSLRVTEDKLEYLKDVVLKGAVFDRLQKVDSFNSCSQTLSVI